MPRFDRRPARAGRDLGIDFSGSVTYAPPSPGQDCSCGNSAIVVSLASTGPDAAAAFRPHGFSAVQPASDHTAAAACRRAGRDRLAGSHQPLHRVKRIAEDVAHPLHRAEQVADHREAAAFDAGIEDGRPAGLKDAAVDLGRLEMRVDFFLDPHELPAAGQIVEAGLQGEVGHGEVVVPRQSRCSLCEQEENAAFA